MAAPSGCNGRLCYKSRAEEGNSGWRTVSMEKYPVCPGNSEMTNLARVEGSLFRVEKVSLEK